MSSTAFITLLFLVLFTIHLSDAGRPRRRSCPSRCVSPIRAYFQCNQTFFRIKNCLLVRCRKRRGRRGRACVPIPPSPSPSITPSVTPSTTPSPVPTPKDNRIFRLPRGGLSCPPGKIPITSEVGEDDCDVTDRAYEVFVGMNTETLKSSLCATGRFSVGGNTAGCRICGTGNDFARTLHIVIDYRRSADVLAGDDRCFGTELTRVMSEAIYAFATLDELCNRDFNVADGGTDITVDLVNAMPGILQDGFCKDA